MRTLFLILLLSPVSTLGHLSDIETAKRRPLEGRSQQLSPSLETLHNLQLSQTSQLSASDERTLQREFLLQQFIHRLTTATHQTILRTQVLWESAAHCIESTPQNGAHAGLHIFSQNCSDSTLQSQILVLQDPDRGSSILGDRRPRRSTFAPPLNSCSRVEEGEDEEQHCCVDSVIVDFAALGWHFILSPPTLEFTYCRCLAASPKLKFRFFACNTLIYFGHFPACI